MPFDIQGEYQTYNQYTVDGARRFSPTEGGGTGQYVHFKNYAPEKIAYAMDGYEFEALRH